MRTLKRGINDSSRAARLASQKKGVIVARRPVERLRRKLLELRSTRKALEKQVYPKISLIRAQRMPDDSTRVYDMKRGVRTTIAAMQKRALSIQKALDAVHPKAFMTERYRRIYVNMIDRYAAYNHSVYLKIEDHREKSAWCGSAGQSPERTRSICVQQMHRERRIAFGVKNSTIEGLALSEPSFRRIRSLVRARIDDEDRRVQLAHEWKQKQDRRKRVEVDVDELERISSRAGRKWLKRTAKPSKHVSGAIRKLVAATSEFHDPDTLEERWTELMAKREALEFELSDRQTIFERRQKLASKLAVRVHELRDAGSHVYQKREVERQIWDAKEKLESAQLQEQTVIKSLDILQQKLSEVRYGVQQTMERIGLLNYPLNKLNSYRVGSGDDAEGQEVQEVQEGTLAMLDCGWGSS